MRSSHRSSSRPWAPYGRSTPDCGGWEGIDFPILGVAAAIELGSVGVCTAARIVLGAVASAPLRVETAETALVGRPLTAETITEAARKLARPLNNTDLTSRYRKRMIPIFVTRTLKELTET